MSRGRQNVSFDGLLQETVLGTFTNLRGFADLNDLTEVSVAMPYQGSKNSPGSGYQRKLDEQHVEDIKRFLNKGRYRFFPEIVLSLRSKGAKTEPERIRRAERWLSEFARWFVRIGGADMPLPADSSIFWTVFKRDFDKQAGKVFIATSFINEQALYKDVGTAIDEALKLVQCGSSEHSSRAKTG